MRLSLCGMEAQFWSEKVSHESMIIDSRGVVFEHKTSNLVAAPLCSYCTCHFAATISVHSTSYLGPPLNMVCCFLLYGHVAVPFTYFGDSHVGVKRLLSLVWVVSWLCGLTSRFPDSFVSNEMHIESRRNHT